MFQTNITWFSLQLIYTSIIFKSSFASFNFQVDVWLKKKKQNEPTQCFPLNLFYNLRDQTNLTSLLSFPQPILYSLRFEIKLVPFLRRICLSSSTWVEQNENYEIFHFVPYASFLRNLPFFNTRPTWFSIFNLSAQYSFNN